MTSLLGGSASARGALDPLAAAPHPARAGARVARPIEGREERADLDPRAVFAAARSYGDDPADLSQARARKAAGSAISSALGIRPSLVGLSLALQGGGQSIRNARFQKPRGFEAAEAAALRALSYAGWRPECAVSKAPAAVGEGGSLVAARPDARRPDPLAAAPHPARLPASRPPHEGEGNARDLAAEILVCLEEDPCTVAELEALVDARALAVAEALQLLASTNRAHQGDDGRWRPGKRASRPVAPSLVTPGRLAPAPGRIAADLRPGWIDNGVRAAPAGPAVTIAELVLQALAGMPGTTQSLASRIDRKELAVVAGVRELLASGRIVERPIEGGTRRFEYALAEAGA